MPGALAAVASIVIAAAALLIAVIAPAAGSPVRAAAAAAGAAGNEAGKAPVRVVVDSLSPALPTVGSTLTVAGTLTNDSNISLRDVGVRLRAGGSAVASRSALTAAATDPSAVDGPTLAQRPGFVTLAPGASTTFELSVPLTQTTFPATGVLPLAVESVDGAAALLGAVGTTILWYPEKANAPSPVPLTMLWPLVSSAARDADGVVLGGEVASEFAPGGRLDTLLALGAREAAGLSWAVDPQTLEMVGTLGSSHQELVDGAPVPRPPDAAASNWLALLRQSTSAPGVDVTASGYANPDSTAEVSAGLDRDLVRATATASEQVELGLGRKVRDGVSWPPGGLVDDRTLGLLRGAGVNSVVLSQAGVESAAAVLPAGGLIRLGTDSGPITAIVGDDELANSLRMLAAGPQWATLGRQNYLALTALAAQDGLGIVVSPPLDWSPAPDQLLTLLAAVKASGLTTPRTLTTLLAGTDDAPAGQLDPIAAADASAAASAPQQSQQMAGVAQINQTLDALGAITEAPEPGVVPVRSAALRCASAQWRSQPDLGALLLQRTDAQATALHDRVRISSQGPVAFPGAEGRVPVTVSNDLSVPVTVSVTLRADEDYRLEDQPPRPVRVAAGQRLSLEVPVRVVGSEPLTVTAGLIAPDGSEYGAGEVFELRTTAYTRVAGWVVAGALGLLVVLVVINVARRIRSSRKEAAGDSEPA